MTPDRFQVLLAAPDSDETRQQLRDLALDTTHNYSVALPKTTKDYLQAFCDNTSSGLRRRWVARILLRLIRTSQQVLRLSQDLRYGLGDLILSQDESEEIRILAGLIMQQCIQHGVAFNSFWSSDKVKNSDLTFPPAGSRWMEDFQTFLDTLSDLALANLSTDSPILYPVAFIASNGHQLSFDTNIAISVIQTDCLTIIAPDASLEHIEFMDVSYKNIAAIKIKKSPVHTSQSQSQPHSLPSVPQSIVFALKKETGYVLDGTQQVGVSVRLDLYDLDDATEMKASIERYTGRLSQSKMSSSPAIQGGPVTPGRDHKSSGPRDDSKLFDVIAHDDSPPAETQEQHASGNSTSDTSRPNTRQSQNKKDGSNKPIASQTVVTPARSINEPHFVSSGQHPKSTASASGKLSKISKNLKETIAKQHLPSAKTKEAPTTKSKIAKENSAKAPRHRTQDPKTKPPEAGQKPKATKRQAADDDDEYVPGTQATRDDAPPSKKRKTRASTNLAAPSENTEAEARPKQPVQAKKTLNAVARMQQTSDVRPAQINMSGAPTASGNSPMKPQVPSTPSGRNSHVFKTPQPTQKLRTSGNTSRSRGHQDSGKRGIMSSNSKPFPASPTAESTAISGHADRHEVELEKLQGDLQTARSDPFVRRQEAHHPTSFARRLTGSGGTEHFDNDIVVPALDDVNQMDNMYNGEAAQPGLVIASATPSAGTKAQGTDEGTGLSKHSLARLSYPTAPESVLQINKPKLKSQSQQAGHPLRRQLSPPSAEEGRSYNSGRVDLTGYNSKEQAIFTNAMLGSARTRGPKVRKYRKENVLAAASPAPVDEYLQDEDIPDSPTSQSYGETTLVEYEKDVYTPARHGQRTPLRFPSSPLPLPRTASSRSSTSIEASSPSTPTITASEAEERAWEASLKPHQRLLQDAILRTSKRVVRNIIDNESAISDIVDEFAGDSEGLVEGLTERLDREYNSVLKDLHGSTKSLKKTLEAAVKDLAKERERVASKA